MEQQTKLVYRRRKSRIAIARAAFLCAIVALPFETLVAQTSTASPTPAAPAQDGINSGRYQIHSSVELGYRSTNVTGSTDMYDTLVNLQSGPRILDQT
jgi:hypothetical protein